MFISSSTPEGYPVHCSVCGATSILLLSTPPGDAVCHRCGSHIWASAVSHRLSEVDLPCEATIDLLSPTDREETICEMIGTIGRVRLWTDRFTEVISAAAIDRELRCTTAIGRGFAVPHVSHPHVKSPALAIGYSSAGIDFEAFDNTTVHTVLMLVTPADPASHMAALMRIARALELVA